MDAPKKPEARNSTRNKKKEMVLPLAPQDEHTQPLAAEHLPNASFQRTTELVTELLATLGHEFRTPLATIKGYSSMLARLDERLSPKERLEYLQVIQEASQRLETLVERVLEMSSLESGTMQINRGAVDMLAVTREAIARAQQHVPKVLRERLTFHLHVRDEAKNPLQEIPPVYGHHRSLRTVLEHLLENAVRFSPEGGRIDVILQPAQPGQMAHPPISALPETSFLEICVCDYGIGIPVEHLDRIFERFYQVDTSLTREVNGLGLGLAICRSLIDFHQGQLWAESCSAGGSAFHLWLPVASAAFPD